MVAVDVGVNESGFRELEFIQCGPYRNCGSSSSWLEMCSRISRNSGRQFSKLALCAEATLGLSLTRFAPYWGRLWNRMKCLVNEALNVRQVKCLSSHACSRKEWQCGREPVSCEVDAWLMARRRSHLPSHGAILVLILNLQAD